MSGFSMLDRVVLPSHTLPMKCAISVPDEVFAAVTAQVARLGISRSEFFAVAARRYLDLLALEEQAAAVDALLDTIGLTGPEGDSYWVVDAGRRLLAQVPWDTDA